jgi:nucleoside-diphosphate-sugar epimerase
MDKILTLIIGKSSNLSIALDKSIPNAILISSLSISKELDNIKYVQYDSINIIFNQFQQSTKLNSLDNPIEYIQRSIVSTTQVLSYFKDKEIQIKKIIYTSSSSVYGNNTSCNEKDDINPQSLHSSLKLANEQLIKKFSIDNNINYTIARVFNMYGGNDNFSIVSKITNIYKNKSVLNLINNGEAIRDFIYIDDVVYIYKKLLFENSCIDILNIATGEGKSVLYILDFLRQKDIVISSNSITREELMVSISNNKLLKDFIGEYKFKNVAEFIYEKIVLK